MPEPFDTLNNLRLASGSVGVAAGAAVFVGIGWLAGRVLAPRIGEWESRVRAGRGIALALAIVLAARVAADVLPFPGGVVVRDRAYYLGPSVAACAIVLAGSLLAAGVFLHRGPRGVAPLVLVGGIGLGWLLYPFARGEPGAAGYLATAKHLGFLSVHGVRFTAFPFAGAAGLATAVLFAFAVAGRARLYRWPAAASVLLLLLVHGVENRAVWRAPAPDGRVDPADFSSAEAFAASRALNHARATGSRDWLRAALAPVVAGRDPVYLVRWTRVAVELDDEGAIDIATRAGASASWPGDEGLAALGEFLDLVTGAAARRGENAPLRAAVARYRAGGTPLERGEALLDCSITAGAEGREDLARLCLTALLQVADRLTASGESRGPELVREAAARVRSESLLRILVDAAGELEEPRDRVDLLLGCARTAGAIDNRALGGEILTRAIRLTADIPDYADRYSALDRCQSEAATFGFPELASKAAEGQRTADRGRVDVGPVAARTRPFVGSPPAEATVAAVGERGTVAGRAGRERRAHVYVLVNPLSNPANAGQWWVQSPVSWKGIATESTFDCECIFGNGPSGVGQFFAVVAVSTDEELQPGGPRALPKNAPSSANVLFSNVKIVKRTR